MITKDAVEVDENLRARERALSFGTSKLSLQRLVFVKELVDSAHEVGYEDTVKNLLPLVRQLASDPEVLVRHSLVGQFGDLAGFLIQSNPERGYQRVVDDLLPIVSHLLTERAAEVRQGTADALTILASHLRPGERGDQVLMAVISLSHNNDDEDARSTAVQLLNSLAETLGRDLCQQFVGVELVALCEDPAFRVRKATASSFAEVARVVGDEYVLRRLLPAFSNLVHDVHWGVRKAAAESLIGLAMAVKPESREGPLVPLMNSLLKDTSRWVRMSALQQLGYMISALEKPERVPASLFTQYVESIEQTKANPDAADISFHCGYTFAAVTQTMGVSCWSTLREPFGSLCCDTQMKTRKSLAASIHIIAGTVGPDITETEVLPRFEALLQDNANEVRFAAVRNVAALLRAAPGLAPQQRVLRSLQGCAGKASNWRLRSLAASQLGCMCDALTGEQTSAISRVAASGKCGTDKAAMIAESPGRSSLIGSVVVPLFLQLCRDGVAEVRNEAARVTARVLRAAAPELFADPGASEGSSGGLVREPLPASTARLVKQLIRTFGRGRTFRHRMAYIRMCDSIIRESRETAMRETLPHFFSELLLQPLKRLSDDPVKNVRLCWATAMLPHIRAGGRLGQNIKLVKAAARMAKTDPDHEVCRLFAGVNFPDVLLSDQGDGSGSDKDASWLTNEGGTGDSSECSDVGVLEEDEFREGDPVLGCVQNSREEPGAELVLDHEHTKSGIPSLAAHLQQDSLKGVAPPSCGSPRGSVDAGEANRIPPKMGPSVHDAIEDGLVRQGDLERDLDATFADRRLVAEAEGEVEGMDVAYSPSVLDAAGDLSAREIAAAGEEAARSVDVLDCLGVAPSPLAAMQEEQVHAEVSRELLQPSDVLQVAAPACSDILGSLAPLGTQDALQNVGPEESFVTCQISNPDATSAKAPEAVVDSGSSQTADVHSGEDALHGASPESSHESLPQPSTLGAVES